MAATKHKAPSIILSTGALGCATRKKTVDADYILRVAHFNMRVIEFSSMDVLNMLVKTKAQIIETLVDKLKDQDETESESEEVTKIQSFFSFISFGS